MRKEVKRLAAPWINEELRSLMEFRNNTTTTGEGQRQYRLTKLIQRSKKTGKKSLYETK